MDIKTGHLVEQPTEAQIKSGNYLQVPDYLQKKAIEELNGKKEVFIDLKSDSILSKWAKKERNKNKLKMIKKSRKVNRK